ncbi:MAG: hypothetical protein IJV05_10565 [Muribaculaceae bacterium]|nr:hypothetical protein [Muribaculaceae bacterium]
MLGRRTMMIWIAALAATAMPIAAQVSVDYYREDGTRYVCSQQEVMYDDYFHAARFAVAATSDAAGLVTFSLEVTYDEGLLDVAQGDSLTLVLRGGDRIVLKTAQKVTRADIVKRHFLTYNNYYVTCRYTMSAYDIQRITRNRVTKLSSQTQGFTFDRKLDKFQDRFRRQFTAVYRYLSEEP